MKSVVGCCFYTNWLKFSTHCIHSQNMGGTLSVRAWNHKFIQTINIMIITCDENRLVSWTARKVSLFNFLLWTLKWRDITKKLFLFSFSKIAITFWHFFPTLVLFVLFSSGKNSMSIMWSKAISGNKKKNKTKKHGIFHYGTPLPVGMTDLFFSVVLEINDCVHVIRYPTPNSNFSNFFYYVFSDFLIK